MQNVVEKLFPDSVLENQTRSYIQISSLKFWQFVFIICQVEGAIEIYQNQAADHLLLAYYSFLLF